MKINRGKFYMLFSGKDNISVNVDDNTIIAENKNEILGILDEL